IVGAEAVYGGERAVLLAKDREGYAGICRLLTRIHRALNAPAPARAAPGTGARPTSSAAHVRAGPGSARGGEAFGDASGACRDDMVRDRKGPDLRSMSWSRGEDCVENEDAANDGAAGDLDDDDDLPPVEITARPGRRAPDPRFSLAAALAD